MSSYETIELGNKVDLSSIRKRSEPEEDDDYSDIGEISPELEMMLQEPMMQEYYEPPPPPLTKEEVIQKRRLILKAKKYRDIEFQKYLSDFNDLDFNSMSIDDLEMTIEEMSFTVNSRSSGQDAVQMFAMGCQTMESIIGPLLNLKIHGMTQVLVGQERVTDLVKEISLKNDSLVYVPPEQKLMALIGITAITIHKHNKAMEEVTPVLEEQCDKNLVDQFDDL